MSIAEELRELRKRARKHGYKILKDSKTRKFFLVNTRESESLQYALNYPVLESLKEIAEDLDEMDKQSADNEEIPF